MRKLPPRVIYYFWYVNFTILFLPLIIAIILVRIILSPKNLIKVMVVIIAGFAIAFFSYGAFEMFISVKELIYGFKNWFIDISSIIVFWSIFFGKIVLLWLGLSYIWGWLEYKFFRYELDAEALEIKKGIITKRHFTIPYKKIQNIEISRSLVQRFIGLSTLDIYVAKNRVGVLFCFSKEGAEEIRKEIMVKTKEVNI